MGVRARSWPHRSTTSSGCGGGLHLVSVGLAIGSAALVTALVKDPIDWMIVGFIATFVYLIVIAAQFTLADAHGQ